MSDLAVETRGLSKRFGRQLAVDDLDLAVPRGSVFGFLGPNGSGKTTTIRILLGLAAASAGEVRVLGHQMPGSLGEVLPRVGALVEGPAAYPFLSGEANLLRLDAAHSHAPRSSRADRVAAALDRVGLSHAGSKRVRAYSLGMKQRLGIAGALLMPRELLVLDEPTNGLDPQGTREVRNLVRSLAQDGTTVVVSSHLLAEVEQICTHVGVMRQGRLVAQGSLDAFRTQGRSHLHILTPDPALAHTVLSQQALPVLPTTPLVADSSIPAGDTPTLVADSSIPAATAPHTPPPADSPTPASASSPTSADTSFPAGTPSTASAESSTPAQPDATQNVASTGIELSKAEGGEPAARAAGDAAQAPPSERAAVVRAELPPDGPLPETVAAALVEAGVRLRGFGVEQETLEDRFVALTGEGFDVAQ